MALRWRSVVAMCDCDRGDTKFGRLGDQCLRPRLRPRSSSSERLERGYAFRIADCRSRWVCSTDAP
eukprot:3603695-Alexandrium_andersonii.AAC.1